MASRHWLVPEAVVHCRKPLGRIAWPARRALSLMRYFEGAATSVPPLFGSGRSDFSIALIVGYGLRPSRQRLGHDWRGQRWTSRFPCKRLLRMPGSTTTRGRHVSCGIDTRRIAFCGTENISTPNLSYAYLLPVSRRTRPPHQNRLTC